MWTIAGGILLALGILVAIPLVPLAVFWAFIGLICTLERLEAGLARVQAAIVHSVRWCVHRLRPSEHATADNA